MGPGGLQSAALVISECQMGILDPAASVAPALAAQAAERGIVALRAPMPELKAARYERLAADAVALKIGRAHV